MTKTTQQSSSVNKNHAHLCQTIMMLSKSLLTWSGLRTFSGYIGEALDFTLNLYYDRPCEPAGQAR